MKKKFLKNLKKRGFSLVELVIAMAITVLITAAAMAFMGPVQGIIKSLESNTQVDTVADTLNNYLYTRLSKSVSYNIGIYENTVLVGSETTEGTPAYALDGIISRMDNVAIEDAYAILIKPTDDGYRLYDIGKVDLTADSGNNIKTKLGNYSTYNLLPNDYYGDVNYVFTFQTVTSSGDGRWCKLGVSPLDEKGEEIVSPRYQMFKLLNMSLLGATPASATELETKGYAFDDDGVRSNKNIVIIYTRKDYRLLGD